MGYADAKHRPHARHTGEAPQNIIKEAPYHLSVTLDTWGPVDNCFTTLYDMLQANWGDVPSRSVENDDVDAPGEIWPHRVDFLQRQTGWLGLSAAQRTYVDSCFAGKTLRQALEMFTFSFLIDGCSRACTHQLVRTRIGAGMMQHGGRDNDWRHRSWVMPETIRRACQREEGGTHNPERQDLLHCVKDWTPIKTYLAKTPLFDNFDDPANSGRRDDPTLRQAIAQYLRNGRELYSALVDAGIPWEDARRLLWMGTSTYIHIYYNYVALADVLANRLEHIMDWEINCVAQLMLREIKMKCPPLFSKYLGSHSDRQQKEAFAGLESWTPVGKYSNPYERCAQCKHAQENHNAMLRDEHGAILGAGCEVCLREGNIEQRRRARHQYEPADSLPREHRPEQNPFWILAPESMNGEPIRWIPTNGRYPQELRP